MLLITACTKDNIKYILSKVTYEKAHDIYKCKYKNKKFLLTVTGLGKVNIVSSLQKIFDSENIDSIINIGTCTSLCNLKIFDVFIVDKSLHCDVNFLGLGYKNPNMNDYVFNSDFVLNKKLCRSCFDLNRVYKEGIMGSSDYFLPCFNYLNNLKCKYKIEGFDTESAVHSEFAMKNNLKFSSLKVVSNINSNKCQYELYNKDASVLSQRIILNFISNC